MGVLTAGSGALSTTGCSTGQTYSVTSPNGILRVDLRRGEDGGLRYSIDRGDKPVLLESRLGVQMDDADFVSDLSFQSVSDVTPVNDRYRLWTGKRRDIVYTANERRFSFVNAENDEIEIVFRVSNDGVAFRYRFPGQSDKAEKVVKEATSFVMPSDTRAWLQPMQVAKSGWRKTNPAYEEHYRMAIPAGTDAPTDAGWVFPALYKSNGTWILISETGMDGQYCASRLQPEAPGGEYRLGFPGDEETFQYNSVSGPAKPESRRPFASPWRILAIGSLATIVESTLGTDLAPPAIDMDTSFIQPGQASWSWAILKDESILYDVQKRFIDYAADMQWEYTLIDVNWDTRIGYDRVKELAEYAAGKGVGLFLWYNSSGDWNETDYHPKSRLLTAESRRAEFERLQAMGIKGIKVDFFPGDGMSAIQYYIDILEDAADFELLVNCHGSTLPRGLHRTYPNLMTMESVRGFEFITFFQETADREASHSAMLPYTRNAFDPMDFTPTVFDQIPDRTRKTSNGFQLALPVIFLSGVQHIAETPEGMATVPDYVRDFMRELPEQWDETRFIDGYPGELAVIARRAGETWHVAGINGEKTDKDLLLDLSFIEGRRGTVLTDGADAFSFSRREVTASAETDVSLRGAGGFVMVFKP